MEVKMETIRCKRCGEYRKFTGNEGICIFCEKDTVRGKVIECRTGLINDNMWMI